MLGLFAEARSGNRKRIFEQLDIGHNFVLEINAHNVKTEWGIVCDLAEKFAGYC